MSIYFLKFLYRLNRHVHRKIRRQWSTYYTKYLFLVNGVRYGAGFESNGVPVIDINRGCQLTIGKSFRINNGLFFNRIGRQQPCFIIADYGGVITIGDNIGLSGTAIICHKKVSIGNNVRIGGNTVIYDTDFHNLDFTKRTAIQEDKADVNKKAVFIEDNAFIGAHSTILKGVTIGRNSVIGAGSVVSKNIPANQIWAGNPARFVRCLIPETISDCVRAVERNEIFNQFPEHP